MAKRARQSFLPGLADETTAAEITAAENTAAEIPPADTPAAVTPTVGDVPVAHDVPVEVVPASDAESMLGGLTPPARQADPQLAPWELPGEERSAPSARQEVAVSPVASTYRESVWVIDAPSLIYQVFHALPEMSSPQGEPVHAVYGFTNDLMRILREHKPDYWFVAFDTSAPTFRDELYSEYKAGREAMPDDLSIQLPLIWEMLQALNIPCLALDGMEADDLLATVAKRTTERGGVCYVVSSDKDCRQLLSDSVFIYHLRKNAVFNTESLAAEWGVRPDQVVDFQSLVGDSVDNVPGVPLIGPKNAQQLLATYGTLDRILDGAESMPKSKRRENLIQYRELALQCRELVRLKDDVEIDLDWEAARPGQFNWDAAADLFERLGFRRLTEDMRRGAAKAAALANKGKAAEAKPEIPADPVPWVHDYQAIKTADELTAFVTLLGQQKRFAFDTETTGLRGTESHLVGLSFSWEAGKAYYLPLRVPGGEPHLDPESALAALAPVLGDPLIGKIAHNAKFDILALRRAGVEVRGLVCDTMLASYLLDPGARAHGLDELSLKLLKHRTMKITELIGTGKKQKTMDQVPLELITYYAAEDADVTWRLYDQLLPPLQARNLAELLDTLEIPLVEVLVELEFNGVRVDIPRLAALSAQFTAKLADLEKEIHALAGREFNINSPKQLQEILFKELKLPARKQIASGSSTDVEVLEELKRYHPLPAKLIAYRQYAKLKGTYVDALPDLVSPTTGHVHASFNQHVAATGRLSSSDPNLQNIPIRTDEGREIRSAFLPAQPDWLLLTADYSQIELRMLAHYTGDAVLCQAFAEDQDIHALVASQVYSVPLDQVTKEQRGVAKTVNFGIIYGQSPYGLARQLGIEQNEAKKFIEQYFARYPGVEEFLQKTLAEARANGYVRTILGRRRNVSGIRSRVGRQRNLSERTAINTVIQGSAADLIKHAMLAIHARLHRERRAARMLLQIHDELVFEAPPAELESLADLVRTEMTGGMPLVVPLKVDIAVGPNWLETHTYPAEV